jgi:nitrogenase molybdenum-iron protein alpha/beta subunit
MKDWHVHVFTSTYTADVSGVCSAMYELGGMSVLHDPSGCNSTYTTHDEPRWYGSESLMFISGLDEMTAVMGDDSVIVNDVVNAAKGLKPRFITLCGASIPHIIAFDYKGVAKLIEDKCGIPVLPVPTDGLKMYTSGVGLALREWMRRFADLSIKPEEGVINLLGVTPIDFSRKEIVDEMKASFERRGFSVNAVCAMGESFEAMEKVCRAQANVVVSSAGLLPAKFLKAKAGIPFVVGTPVGSAACDKLCKKIRQSAKDKESRYLYDSDRYTTRVEKPDLLIINEEVNAFSMAEAARAALSEDAKIEVLFPDADEGLDEDLLVARIKEAKAVMCDPLFFPAFAGSSAKLIRMPHEGYSGRIYRDEIPVFTGDAFDIKKML